MQALIIGSVGAFLTLSAYHQTLLPPVHFITAGLLLLMFALLVGEGFISLQMIDTLLPFLSLFLVSTCYFSTSFIDGYLQQIALVLLGVKWLSSVPSELYKQLLCMHLAGGCPLIFNCRYMHPHASILQIESQSKRCKDHFYIDLASITKQE